MKKIVFVLFAQLFCTYQQIFAMQPDSLSNWYQQYIMSYAHEYAANNSEQMFEEMQLPRKIRTSILEGERLADKNLAIFQKLTESWAKNIFLSLEKKQNEFKNACFIGNIEEMSKILENISPHQPLLINAPIINNTNNGYVFPLHIAAKLGYNQLAHMLITHKAMIDIRDSSHATPLEFAILQNKVAVTETLLEHGATMPKNITAIDPEILKLLYAHGADIDLPEGN